MPGVTSMSGKRDLRPKTEDRDLRAKTAYLMVKGSIGEDLSSRDELMEALQNAGYNPTPKTLRKHWTESTKRMTFSQFCYLTEVEPLPTHNDLLAAFEKLDEKGQGYLNHDNLLTDMTTRGEKLPSEAVKHLLKDKTFSKENRFDYRTYCKVVVETSQSLSELAIEKYKKDEELSMVNSKTYKVKRKVSLPSPKTRKLSTPRENPETVFTTSSKGTFYFEGDNIISHQYLFTIDQSAKVKISMKPEPRSRSKTGLVDTQLYIFDEHKRFVCRTGECLANGVFEWSGFLDKGRYLAIPFTSGARLKRRKKGHGVEEQRNIITRSPKLQLTQEFQLLLSEIYSQIDLDGNGYLSRKEFNLFNWRTSGEEVTDDEWGVVEDNFPLMSGELTLEGFLALHQMEAEDNNGDDTELWVTVHAMGYNRCFEQDESAGFVITVESSQTEHLLMVSGLKSGGLLLEKTVTRCAIEADRKPSKATGGNNILMYRETTPQRVSLVLQNKSEMTARVELDLSGSEGIVTSRENNTDSHLYEVTISKNSSKLAAHILPKQDHRPFKVLVKCST